MSWQLFKACTECGVQADRACRTPDDTPALLPCPQRRTCSTADPLVVRRWKAQRRRLAVLNGLLPASSGPAVAVVTNLLEATEAEGNNEPTFTSVKGQP